MYLEKVCKRKQIDRDNEFTKTNVINGNMEIHKWRKKTINKGKCTKTKTNKPRTRERQRQKISKEIQRTKKK